MIDAELITKLSFIALVFLISLYFDLKYQRIPNVLCVFALISGFTLQCFFSGWSGLLTAFIGAGVAFLILFPAFIFRLLGAGDVKLMVAIGSFLDLNLLFWSIIYSLAAGIFTSIIIALYKLGWTSVKKLVAHYFRCLYLRHYIKPDNEAFLKMKVPFAPALAIGWVVACSQDTRVLWLISDVRFTLGV